MAERARAVNDAEAAIMDCLCTDRRMVSPNVAPVVRSQGSPLRGSPGAQKMMSRSNEEGKIETLPGCAHTVLHRSRA